MKYMTHSRKAWTLALFSTLILFLSQNSFAQSTQNRIIQPAVVTLTIAPDARAGAMGDVGVASSPDANSMFYNSAKYAFVDNMFGASFSYCPWMRSLVSDISLTYLSGYYKLDKNQTIAASLHFFTLGSIEHTIDGINTLGTFKPNEFSIDAAYARKFSNTLSGAVALRYIHSNLTSGLDSYGTGGSHPTKPGNTVAADISVYQRIPVTLGDYEGTFSWGAAITNMGAKISYTDDNLEKDFIPTMLRVGPGLSFDIDEYNSLSFMVDFTKYLIPTPPVRENGQIIAGMDPDVSVPVGMLHSFYDAPDGLSEELNEINIAGGIEYWYNKQFALRGGYYYQPKTKGDIQYATLGAGIRYNVLGIDISYLASVKANNPLANTLRISISVAMGEAPK